MASRPASTPSTSHLGKTHDKSDGHGSHQLTFCARRQFQGWITFFSWISLLAGVVNICANVTLTIAAANYPNYVNQSWHTILLMYAYLGFFAVLNMYAFVSLPHDTDRYTTSNTSYKAAVASYWARVSLRCLEKLVFSRR